ncbi:MAG: DUF1297 domain-containing protein [Candidatus Kaiserbacteria bacterium]|nr:DUF1297 domain-containing protein [Candidatus Kaiserbacteria bacterium]
MDIAGILASYDSNNIAVAALGGHSALDSCAGARAEGLKSLVIARKDRLRAYKALLRKGDLGCIDKIMEVDAYADIVREDLQEALRSENAVLMHSRYFWVYFDFKDVEEKLRVPFFGSRELIRLEERDQKPNQYDLLQAAGIRIPKIFSSHKEIDRLTLTKAPNAVRTYERENFVAASPEEWQRIADEKIAKGAVTEAALKDAVIEEFILGAQVNFNFFYSPLHERLELLGTDTRRQTNLDGWLRLPANEQLKIPGAPLHIETGHLAVTVKESLLEKIYEAGEKFVAVCKKYHPKGMIGPFALQGAIETDGKREEAVIFDVSFRMPGSPGITATPYSQYLFGEPVSMGRRSAIEIKEAAASGRLSEILT